ncbi:MAG: SHD1 domain-containing protein [Rubripirellula sp.]
MGCALRAMSVLRASVGLAVVFTVAETADARIWKDVTGLYTINADLVGFDDDMVILQRENKELGSCPIDKLCKEDREYLKSKEALEIHNSHIDQTQTWAMTNGLKVVGKIVDYERDEVVIKQQDGKVVVNDKPFDGLPEIYQDILLRVVETSESKPMPNKRAFEDWVRTSPNFQNGKSENYNLEGVVFELQDGSQYAVPFYLFAKKEQDMLKSGWDAWLASHKAVPAPPTPATPKTEGDAPVVPAVGLTGNGNAGEAGLPKPAKGITANDRGADGLPKPAKGFTADLGTDVATNPLGQGGATSANKPAAQNYKQDDQAFHLQSLAAAYQRNQQVNQRIAMMNLNMNAVQAGITSAWEITLYPNSGNPYPPKWVVTYGRNSLIATQAALRSNPGYYAGPVRKVSR